MRVIRDEGRIARLRRWSQILGIVGLGALVLGFIVGLQNQLGLQLLGLAVGFLFSQIAVYLAHRYVREPRPDQLLDDALRKVARDGRLYHYVLPAPHVLLTPAGPIIFHAKFQAGQISVSKDAKGNDRWSQKGVWFVRRFFGQEGLGNPTREAHALIGSLANFIRKRAPDIDEVPIGLIIVFTSKHSGRSKALSDLDDAAFPAMHITKVRGYLRSQGRQASLPQETYDGLQAAFDQAAAKILEAEAAEAAA